MTKAYCRECEDLSSMEPGPTRGDMTCRRCGTVYQHRAFGTIGGSGR
jgi:transcription initiation factor TFIIIB Brf1 subunit/transcription initiation factor TFIIB